MWQLKRKLSSVLNQRYVIIGVLSVIVIYFTITFFSLCNVKSIKIEDDSSILVNFTEFKYLISKPPVKVRIENGTKLPSIVIMMFTHPNNEKLRVAIRETWSKSDPRFLVYFGLGAVASAEQQKKIEEEDAKYNDIVQGNFIDAYHNVTYKATMLLKWFTKNANDVNYYIKIDDDVFPNFPYLYNFIKANATEKDFLMGPYVKPELVNRNGKYAVSYEEYKDEYTPPYAIGNYVMLSADVVHAIYEKTKTTRFFWLEDVFLYGFCRIQIDVPIKTINDHIYWHHEVDGLTQNKTYPLRRDWLFTAPVINDNLTRFFWDKLKH